MPRMIPHGLCIISRVRIDASAPTRIDLAGGTLDIWPLYLFHDGAQTLNAAISLRAHAARSRSRSDRPHRHRLGGHARARVEVDHWSRAARASRPAAARPAARTSSRSAASSCDTRSESPVGRRHRRLVGAEHRRLRRARTRGPAAHSTAEELLQIAMNVEAQAIDVPTGVQDYRPALYGGIAAVELGVNGVRRVALAVDPQELAAAARRSPTPAPRATPGINNWDVTKRHIDGDRHVQRSFERIRDIAVAMRDGARAAATGPRSAARSPRVGEPQAARAGRHDAGDRRHARGAAPGRRDRRQGLRRRRRRLPVLLRRSRRASPASGARWPTPARGVLDFTIESGG